MIKLKENKKLIIVIIAILLAFTVFAINSVGVFAMDYKPKAPTNLTAETISSAGQKVYNEWILRLVIIAGVLGGSIPLLKMIFQASSATKRVEAKDAVTSIGIALVALVALPQAIIWMLKAIGA